MVLPFGPDDPEPCWPQLGRQCLKCIIEEDEYLAEGDECVPDVALVEWRGGKKKAGKGPWPVYEAEVLSIARK